jgi:hypothetical protein
LQTQKVPGYHRLQLAQALKTKLSCSPQSLGSQWVCVPFGLATICARTIHCVGVLNPICPRRNIPNSVFTLLIHYFINTLRSPKHHSMQSTYTSAPPSIAT